MTETALNPEQLVAVEATGRVFVSAGAGTGKTSVLVERFVRAVCEAGYDVDSILVITYTRKAAGELRARIRGALHDRGRHELARALDGAWISTIHGFCSRLLKAHPQVKEVFIEATPTTPARPTGTSACRATAPSRWCATSPTTA